MLDQESIKSSLFEKKETFLFYWILTGVAITMFFICLSAEATFDTGDGLSHYFISRYSWQHPELLLDHWGKPVFTLLSSPFSQFGLIGMSVFQIICGLATSYFGFRIAQKLQLKFGWLLPVFICFAPIYFAVINSGLTEILFGCLLMLAVWMLFEKKFIAAAIIASFLPFVRLDAYVTVPLITLVIVFRKQYRALLFLPLGFIIYSIAGYFYFHDSLWLIHQSQSFFDEGYPGMKGGFLHYPAHANFFLGIFLTPLLIVGLSKIVYDLVSASRRKSKGPFFFEEVFLIYGSLFACLLIHTLSYALPGVLNNLGMLRYMVTLIPSAGLIALIGLNFLVVPFNKNNTLQTGIAALFGILVIIVPFTKWFFPFKPDKESLVIREAAKWMKESNIGSSKICYLNPIFPAFYEMDPFDQKKVMHYLNIDDRFPNESLPEGSLLFWDAHYYPNEGKVPLDHLLNHPNFRLVKSFKPDDQFGVLGGNDFAIHVFRVVASDIPNTSAPGILKMWTFEDNTVAADSIFISGEYAATGKCSFKLTHDRAYSPTYEITIGELRTKGIKSITASVELFPVFEEKKSTALIISIENDSVYYYTPTALESIQPKLNTWNKISNSIVIPENAKDTDKLKIYVYRPGEKYIYMDNFIIHF